MAVPQIRFERSTSYEDALGRAAAECGVDREYYDIFGKRHEASLDALKRILSAMRWDVSNTEAIDQRRAHEFAEATTLPLPKTSVLSESSKALPLTLPGHVAGSIRFELALESGERLTGSLETSQMNVWADVELDGNHFRAYELSLPAEAPLGYHALRVFLNEQALGASNVIVCPDRAYLPERLASGGKAGIQRGALWPAVESQLGLR